MTGDDQMTAEELEEERANNEWFTREVFLPMARCVVRSLLAGNDAGCFDTEQYRQAWRAYLKRRLLRDAPAEPAMPVANAESHLRACGLVREVSPGVWVAKEGK